MDSESRNQTSQDIFKENKFSGKIDSQLNYCETFPDAVHVGKRKRQSFADGIFYGKRTNLVPLRTLRNDTLLKDEICPNLRLDSVRNIDCQDVEFFAELGSPEMRSILTRSSKKNYTST